MDLFSLAMDAETREKCFLLNYASRDREGRFDIKLYGVNSARVPVKIVIDNFRPLFFVPRTAPPEAAAGIAERKALPLRAMKDRTLVDCLYYPTYGAFCGARSALRGKGMTVYESDVHPAERYLMERLVKGGFEAAGRWERKGGFLSCRNPRVSGTTVVPELSVLSFDIETNAQTSEILSIACCGREDVVFMQGSGRGVNGVRSCVHEKELMVRFFDHLASEDPDILIGWNVVDFDLRVIQERCSALRVPFRPGREAGGAIVESKTTGRKSARVPGRVVMDVPAMLRASYRVFEEYSLDFVAGEMLGKHKLIRTTAKEKIGEINRLFREDPAGLAAYNLADARLTKEIFEKAALLPNAVERSKRSGLLLDRAGGSVAAFDWLYLPRLHRAGYVAPDAADAAPATEALPGGFVLEPKPGLYENVLAFDFRSLYPSIIMTFKIDPLGLVAPSGRRIKGPAGPSFAADVSILPEIIAELMGARAAAKKENNSCLSQAIKILMNSFYGVLGAQGCRFFSAELAAAITMTGQYIFHETMKYIQKTMGHPVIYGDTDSLFVHAGAGADGPAMARRVTEWLAVTLRERFGTVSALELQYERCFRHFFLPPLRGTAQGSKKHYCGAIETGSGMELVFKGMESARSDWTDMAKEFQHELFTRFFGKKPLEQYVLSVVNDVRAGRADGKLVYKKRLRKKLDDYGGSLPPHAQAAKLLASPEGTIRYYITTAGPQPVENRTAAIDYGHYVECQLRPVAEPVLESLGNSFDKIVSGQQELFTQ
ncbi:MAG: DNA polymerase II [Chitinispirillaceae bacterium]|nr:DNA polymerase II [Chitinispirillaceae bacterium]